MHISEVRTVQGTTRLYVDGQAVPPMSYQFMSSDPDITNNIPIVPEMPSETQLRAMGSAGVKLYFIRLEVNDPERLGVVFDQLKRSVQTLRSCVPDAFAMPWLIIGPYRDFCEKYPRDVQVFDDGSTGGYSSNLKGRIDDAKTPRHTHASLAWRHETSGMLRELARRTMADPLLSDTVVGWFFFPLQHEACYFQDYNHSAKLDDYGPATRLAFRNYLAEKYAGRESLLRRAWHDPSVTFETAQLPVRAQRDFGSCGLFWDPAVSQQVIDYVEIRSRVWEETLECFARAAKEGSGGRVVVGSFWGYLIHNDTLWGGQSYFRRMMDSPFVDFWASPFTYVNKNPGMSVTARFVHRSLQAHGKLFFAEVDTTLTSSNPAQLRRQGMVIPDPVYDAELIKRDFAYLLTEGMNGWRIDWPSGRDEYDENRLLPLWRTIQRVGRESANKPLGSVAQVAAFVEQNSLFAVPNTHSRLTSCAIEQPRIHELPYLGAPVDHYELHDALSGDLKHPMQLFLNAYLLTEEERRAIVRLRTRAKMQVFLYAQGFLSPDEPTASAANMSELTGISLRQAPALSSGRIVLTEAARELGLEPGEETGEFDKLIEGGMAFYQNGGVPCPIETQAPDPAFVVDDPDAIVLGVYRETGQPAFAMKEQDGCTTVYFGSTALTIRVLRALARRAGVFLYTREDATVYACESYVGVHAAQDGPLTLHLPARRMLRDVFSGECFGPCEELPLDIRKGFTRLFEYLD